MDTKEAWARLYQDAREIWDGIKGWMSIQNRPADELARMTGYNLEKLRRGLNGEPVILSTQQVIAFTEALHVVDRRTNTVEDYIEDVVPYEEILQALKNPPTSRPQLW